MLTGEGTLESETVPGRQDSLVTSYSYPPCVWTPCGPGTCNDGNGLQDTYTCDCLGTGYTGTHCDEDIDECTEDTHDCPSPESSCTNTVGSFFCYCNDGWNGTTGYDCEDIDECISSADNNCHINATCTNTAGSFTCACDTGFSGDGVTCSDINECSAGTDDCDSTTEYCVNNIGSFTCPCQSGYEKDMSGDCQDIDECTLGTDDCESLATCGNTAGSYTCTCQSGYQGDGTNSGTGCSDIDECSTNTDDCDTVTTTCSNTVGSFTCDCKSGYEDNGNGGCDDIDECTEGTDNCLDSSSNGRCINYGGGFTCQCLTGYSGNGISACNDMNECSLGTDLCHNKATCTNTVGSYTCACKTGYSGNGRSCSDDDECTLGTDTCMDTIGVCTNTAGSYTCSCTTGYSGNGIDTCNDDDECTDGSNNCHPLLGICSNTIGSFACSCISGYSGDGVVCGNFDECAEGYDDCHSTLGVCVDTAGSYTCYCVNGYEGDGRTCTDIDECVENLDNCHVDFGICTNNNGSYSCSCMNGYAGNGRKCTEIDECIGITCSGRGTCVDLIAKYKCECEYSYWGTDCEYGSTYLDTVEWVLGSLYWSFDHFNTSGDNTFANHNVNASQYNAYPGLAISPSYAIAGNHSIKTRKNGTDDCVDFGDFTGHCIGEPYLCTEGMTLSLWMRLTEDEIKEAGPIYVLSSGVPDSSGFAIYRDTRKVIFVVNDGSTEWTVELSNLIPVNIWKNIGFSWSSSEGLAVYIDSEMVGSDTTGTSNGLSSVLNKLTLGCKYDGSTFTGHASGMFDEMTFWPTRFNDSTRIGWLMGGWDGDNCEVQPCVEGVCWDTGLMSYRCDCFPGYNETDCDTEIIECESNPCQNGGTCTDYIAYYMCACPFGYTGWSCQLDLSPNYDYSNVQALRPEHLLVTPEVNTFYKAASLYFPLYDLPNLDIFGSNISTELGWGNTSLYATFEGQDNWVDLGDYGYDCISFPGECVAGLTVGLWIKLHPGVSPGIVLTSAGNESNAQIGVTLSVTSTLDLQFVVYDGVNNKQIAQVLAADLMFNEWMHLTFAWNPMKNVIKTYMNGKMVPQVQTSLAPEEFNFTVYYETFTVGTLFKNLVSAYPVTVTDVVVWERMLRSFEINHMLGITRRELDMMQYADHYWSSDGFLTRLQLTLSEYYPSWVKDEDDRLDRAGDTETVLMEGRDRKGSALGIIGDGDNWLSMGDFATRCISNPIKCADGFSMSVWVRLAQVYDNDTHYIISSGEQVTRGFSIYQRDVDRLGAAVTDGRTRWIVDIEHIPYIQYDGNNTNPTGVFEIDYLGKWTNLALMWTQRSGLEFYMDGRLIAIDPTGYRKFRVKDDETRLILGRRNDFLGNAANFSWEETAIKEEILEPFKLKESLSRIGNINYKDARYVWDAMALMTGTIDVLTDHPLNRSRSKGFIGPTLGVTIKDEDYVTLPGNPDYIVLGNFHDSFIQDPLKSLSGFSLAMWIKISEGNTTDRRYLISCGGFPDETGISIFAQENSLFVELNYGPNSTLSEYSLPNAFLDKWINIAFTWHPFEQMRFYLNGKERPIVSSFIQELSEVYSNTTDSNTTDVMSYSYSYSYSDDDLTTDTMATSGRKAYQISVLVLGRKSNNDSDFGDFKIRHLAIWDKYLHEKHVHKLLGISALERYFLDISTSYWAFDDPMNYFQAPHSLYGGAKPNNDRHNFSRSLQTNGINGWARLGLFDRDCISDPSVCRYGFGLGFWILVNDLRTGQVCLMTSGADNKNERGFAILQTPISLIFNVSDGSMTWSTTVSQDVLNFNKWMYIGVTWSQTDGLTVMMNGKNVGIRSTMFSDIRSKNDFQELIIGKCSNQRVFAESYFDDIIVIVPEKAKDFPGPELLHGDPICDGYISADEYFNLTSNQVQSFQSQVSIRGEGDGSTRAVDTHPTRNKNGYIEVGDFTDRCLSFPAACSNGVTMSVWFRLKDISNFEDMASNPDSVGYILSSGAQSNHSTGFAVYTDNITTVVEVSNAKCLWKQFYGLGFSDDWTNIGLSWSLSSGISVYVDGIFQVPIDEPEPITEEPPTTSFGNFSMENSTLNGTMLNTTSVNGTNSTMNATEATPISVITKVESCELPTFNFTSSELDDIFSKLHLGKRNDKDSGYLHAEFADFAIWYEVLDPYHPEIGKMLMGEECHKLVVTTNHEELDKYAPWTGTVECDHVHLVDCTQSFDEFFTIISEESTLDDFMYQILKERLANYTHVSAYMTVDELLMSSILLDRALTRDLPLNINTTDAEEDIQDLLSLTSNLFDETRGRRWVTIQQSYAGCTDTMKNFDEYSMSMLERMQDEDGEMSPVNVTFVSDNIILHMDRLDIANTPDQYSFPNYDLGDLQQIQGSWGQPMDSLTFPKNFFDYTTRGTGDVYIIGTLYDSVGGFIPAVTRDSGLDEYNIKVQSRILSLQIEPKLDRELYNPVVIVLENSEELDLSKEEPKCAFWDYDMRGGIGGGWNTSGCDVALADINYTVCYCYHLTHFATLKQPLPPKVEPHDFSMVLYAQKAGTFISLVLMGLLLMIYLCNRKLRTLRNVIHINLMVTMLIAKLTFLVVEYIQHIPVACKVVSIIMQYCYMAAISWMFVEGVHLMAEVRNPLGIRFDQKSRYYFIIGWGMPLLIVGTTLALTFHGYGTASFCWMSIAIEDHTLWIFAGPCVVIVLFNLMMIAIVWRNTTPLAERTDVLKGRKSSLRASAVLLPLLGITWTTALLSINFDHIVHFTYVFIIFNSIQGVLLFLLHGIGNREVLLVLMGKDLDSEFSRVEEMVAVTPEPVRWEQIMMMKPTYKDTDRIIPDEDADEISTASSTL